MPPSQGVSSGPNMTAFQSIILSCEGAAVIPGLGSVCSLRISRIKRRLAGVDIYK